MNFLVLSTSLNPDSRSRIAARAVEKQLNALTDAAHTVQFVDMRELPLPFCDGDAAYAHPHVATITKAIQQADAVVIASSVYNYDFNAVAKNLLELTGRVWLGKVVAFVAAAGGNNSFMAPMSFINSMMLDFRCIVVPRYVYVTDEAFGGSHSDEIVDETILQRIHDLAAETNRLATALAPRA